MPGFNSNSNFRNNVKERFTSYDQLYAKLTELGASSKKAFPLYTIGSDGNDTNIMGYWGYNNAGVISPLGDVRLSLITDGGYGNVSSVDGAQTITLSAEHSLPSSFRGFVWDVSATTELFYDVQMTVSGNTLTIPDTTGISAEDKIYAIGRSEFTIGGSTRNFIMDSGSIRINSGIVVNNASAFHCLCNGFSQKYWLLRTECTKTDSSPTNNSAVGIVSWWSTTKCIGTVWRRLSGADASKVITGTLTSPTFPTTTLDSPQTGNLTKLILMRHNWNASTPLVTGNIMATTTDGIATLSDASTYTSPIGWGAICKPGGAETLSLTITLLLIG